MKKSTMDNIIIFENGIAHRLTESEMMLLANAVSGYEPHNEFQKKAKDNLCSLFLDHLDWGKTSFAGD